MIFLLLILDCNKSLLWSLVSDKDKQKERRSYFLTILSLDCNSIPFAREEARSLGGPVASPIIIPSFSPSVP